MKRIKCSCGEEKMLIDTTHTCDKCPHNGFYLDDEILEKLDKQDDYVYYDEKLRLEASELFGDEIVRTEAMDNGECDMGTNWNAGCSLYTCSACGKQVDFVAFVDGC